MPKNWFTRKHTLPMQFIAPNLFFGTMLSSAISQLLLNQCCRVRVCKGFPKTLWAQSHCLKQNGTKTPNDIHPYALCQFLFSPSNPINPSNGMSCRDWLYKGLGPGATCRLRPLLLRHLRDPLWQGLWHKGSLKLFGGEWKDGKTRGTIFFVFF